MSLAAKPRSILPGRFNIQFFELETQVIYKERLHFHDSYKIINGTT